jgi:hypothetical protein
MQNDLIRTYWKFKGSRDQNKRLQQWTVAPAAHAQSQANFDELLALARQQGSAWMILRPKGVQFLGGNPDLRQIFSQTWAENFDEATRDKDSVHHYGIADRLDRLISNWMQHSRVSNIHYWSRIFVTDQHQGFWRVDTGQRTTNRLDQMDAIWNAGFLARRGRPLRCAQPSEFGSRDSIEYLGRMDRRRLGSSDHIYRKLDQLYRRTNRDCCWPSSP